MWDACVTCRNCMLNFSLGTHNSGNVRYGGIELDNRKVVRPVLLNVVIVVIH